MSPDCWNRDRSGPQWRQWKDGGRCQHDSHADARCTGCMHRRQQSTNVPQDGTGGVK